MNKERYNQIIDEVYKNYKTENQKLADVIGHGFHGGRLTQDEFINKCKTDSYFSETWELKIEERELSYEERFEYSHSVRGLYYLNKTQNQIEEDLNYENIPTKLITITYNNETIESYE